MEKPIEEYKVLTARSASELTTVTKGLMTDGWRPIGSHQVVVINIQNTYAGMQHQRSMYEREYSQTLVR